MTSTMYCWADDRPAAKRRDRVVARILGNLELSVEETSLVVFLLLRRFLRPTYLLEIPVYLCIRVVVEKVLA